MTSTLTRIDRSMVIRGLASSRSEAAALIEGGRVRLGGFPCVKASSMVGPDARIEVTRDDDGDRWVSRGAHKLLKALDAFSIDPAGADCADIGASTGGFTQVLLSRGARSVVAVDVGYGQLAWEIRSDPRVTAIERTNARSLTKDALGGEVALITVDASFISLRLLLPNLQELLSDGGEMIALVKPQFEAGRGRTKRGVVRDPQVHLDVLEGLSAFVGGQTALSLRGVSYSPITGPKGNIEFLFCMKRTPEPPTVSAEDIARAVSDAHAELTPDHLHICNTGEMNAGERPPVDRDRGGSPESE